MSDIRPELTCRYALPMQTIMVWGSSQIEGGKEGERGDSSTIKIYFKGIVCTSGHQACQTHG